MQHGRTYTMNGTVDGQNPTPPKKPWNDASPVLLGTDYPESNNVGVYL